MSIKYSDTLQSNNPSEYGIVNANEVAGSRAVEKIDDLLTIPVGLLTTDKDDSSGPNSIGSLWYVKEEDSYYYLKDFSKHSQVDGWEEFQSGIGYPILDQTAIDSLQARGKLPTDYIKISSAPEFPLVSNNDYIGILFSAVRKLQAEVAKLRNTMNFGLNSYTNTDTALGAVEYDYDDTDDSEPLWAIEESDLTELDGALCPISKDHTLHNTVSNIDSVTIGEGSLSVNSAGAYFQDSDDIGTSFETSTDAKVLLYLTTSNKNLSIEINQEYSGAVSTNKEKVCLIDFNSLGIQNSETEKYNILTIVSRRTKSESDSKYYGKNFIWISVCDYGSLIERKQGYYNLETKQIQDDTYEIELEDAHKLYINKVYFKSIELYKFNAYSKYQNFTTSVEPSIPDDDSDYKYKVAHITIRSVENEDMLKSVVKQLQKNELVFNEDNNSIYIINKTGSYVKIGSSNNSENTTEDDGMTKAQIIEWLETNGIHVTENGDKNITFDNIADITLINQSTGKTFKFTCTPEGDLKSVEIPSKSLKSRVNSLANLSSAYSSDDFEIVSTGSTTGSNEYIRGFAGKLGYNELTASGTSIAENKDIGLYSDRVKIGQIYAPVTGQTTYGCSHAFIELENTSDKDFQLDGCYLHMAKRTSATKVEEHDIALDGILPAGGTYLIRGIQYSDFDQANCFIKVKSYDKEWYYYDETSKTNKLVDFSQGTENSYLLTYGLPGKDNGGTFDYTSTMIMSGWTVDTHKKNIAKSPYIYNPRYIDSISIVNPITSSSNLTWNPPSIDTNGEEVDGSSIYYKASNVSFASQSRDCIFRNTFELDPAKQAFQALSMNDSSRCRGTNSQDFQYLFIDTEKIEFPKTDAARSVDYYTPKASFEKKNLCTDKSKLDSDKPNMVTCSFGIDIHKTRCFNWISTGLFNEYIWIKRDGDTKWSRFESYKGLKTSTVTIPFSKITPFNIQSYNQADVSNIDSSYLDSLKFIYTNNTKLIVTSTGDTTPTYKDGHYVIDSNTHIPESAAGKDSTGAETYTLNITLQYDSYDDDNDLASNSSISKKHFGQFANKTTHNDYCTVESAIYDRITGIFPGANTQYTSHKCILSIDETSEEPVTYYYKVGRADKNLQPDENHVSEQQTFKIYPETYIPKIYQVTDQQGFHWIEYQVWAAAAEKLNSIINTETSAEGSKIIPILINTGDMTQNGTRVNEWLDYYNAGKSLFSHLEQMNVVGNNDLCNTDPEILGTGDDNGKSNAFYFHVFYCYEIDPNILPIISNSKATRYIPSLYYFGNSYSSSDATEVEKNSYRFIMANSEITGVTCQKWFQQLNSSGTTINVYTGYPITSKPSTLKGVQDLYDSSFTTIYTMLYKMMASYANKSNIIVACHEMPFTVITTANLKSSTTNVDRSLDKTKSGSLVGCHMNKISNSDTMSNYWFSRLLESFGVKLCIGGHKHTYACTQPLREFYFYYDTNISSLDEFDSITDESEKISKLSCSINGKMNMESTLSGDTATFTIDSDRLDSYVGDNLKIKATIVNGSIVRYSLSGDATSYVKTINGQPTITPINKFDTSKYPLIKTDEDVGINSGINFLSGSSTFSPYYGVDSDVDGVTYFMLQATGFKLKSNKELPSPQQKFAYAIPSTGGDEYGDKPSNDQLYPMFSEISLDSDKIGVQLIRMKNIVGTKGAFSQSEYGTKTAMCEYFYRQSYSDVVNSASYTSATTDEKLTMINNIMYGKWDTSGGIHTLVEISK